MLKLILGRSGTGKSEYIINKLCTLAQSGGEKLLLLVPEQHSFSAEKKIIDKIGAADAQKINVLSFSRMADAVFLATGGFPMKAVNEGMRSVFMSLALKECSDNLSLYSNQLGRSEFIPIILNSVNEMKSCAATAETISGCKAAVDNETLKQKLSDLALISSCYNAMLGRAYSDPLDNLTLIYNRLLQNNIFAGYTIALDGFSGFTRQELMILELLIKESSSIYLSLCTTSEDIRSGSEVFSKTNDTAKTVISLAHKNSVPVLEPLVLSENKRFTSPALSYLEKNMYTRQNHCELPESDGISIYQGTTVYDECAFVAGEIRRLTTECSFRYSDIAIIARDLSPYKGVLSSALDKQGIAYFMENPKPLSAQSLVIYVTALLETLCSGFSSEHIFKMLKTGFSPLSDNQICELENYAYMWNINGSKWLSPFTQNPDGFVHSEIDANRLSRIESCRMKFIQPLLEFREKTKDKTGAEITRQLYFLLESVNVRRRLKALETSFLDNEESKALQELDRVWEVLIESLDSLYSSLSEFKLTIKEYTEIFKLYMSAEDISYIPQSLDEVTVGTADRIRTDSPKAVFVLGCIQDEFPKIPSSYGIFTENEREVLRESGLSMYDSAEQLSSNELFYVYTSISAPSSRLYLSFYTQGLAGEEKRESSIIRETVSLFNPIDMGENYIIEAHDGSRIRSEGDAFEFLCSNFTVESELISRLKEYFLKTDKAGTIEKITASLEKKPLSISPQSARALFGEEKINLSASQIEKYYLCPYYYFCNYGLNLKERKKAEINAAEYGTLVHYILENLFSRFSISQLEQLSESGKLGEEIHLVLENYLDTVLGGKEDKTRRFLYSLSRVERGVNILVSHIISELSSCGFDPLRCELKIDYEENDGDIEPMSLSLSDGTKINVRGMVDRVDKLEQDGNFYIRIIDYKTGKKDFKINDINFGLNLQMLIYLKAIAQNGEKAFHTKITPAGVLYMPASPALTSQLEGQSEIDRSFAMDGIIVDDSGAVIGAMDEKYLKTKNVMQSSELKTCFDKIDTLIIHMVQGLMNGKINPKPVKAYYKDACEYCPYFNSCGFESGMDAVDLKDKSNSPIYNQEEGM